MRTFNGNIRPFNSDAESLNFHNSYFIASRYEGISFLSEEKKSCTDGTLLISGPDTCTF